MFIEIDRKDKSAAWRQIYSQLAERILSGEIAGETRLPSTRQLSEDLHVPRNAVLEAYDQLLAEGYVTSRQGAGTYVKNDIWMGCTESSATDESTPVPPADTEAIDFRSGIPALDNLPVERWGMIYRRVCREACLPVLSYISPDACLDLQKAVAERIARVRGIRCAPGQIVITNGAVHGISLLERLLLGQGHSAVVEDPVTVDIPKILSAGGARIISVSTDEQGLMIERLPRDVRPSLIYVIPSHQYPMGSILPVSRRLELIQYAREHDAWIAEDDYDSEYRYDGAPIQSMQHLAPERVIYLGTFSKTLFPALRIGYAVLPEPLVAPFTEWIRLTMINLPSLEQLALAAFLEEGYMDKHLHRMNRLYKKRRACLITCLQDAFGDRVRILGAAAGLHLVAAFRDIAFDGTCLERIKEEGVIVYPVEIHAIKKGRHTHEIILGYGNVPEADIKEGIKRLKKALS
jgi:GntR family transcriptional regulator/MocR family aminotransferase